MLGVDGDGFRVPTAHDGEFGQNVVNRRQVGRRQFVFLSIFAHASLGGGKLSRCATFLLGQRLQFVHEPEIDCEVVGMETRTVAPIVSFGEIIWRFDLAGQHSVADRIVPS